MDRVVKTFRLHSGEPVTLDDDGETIELLVEGDGERHAHLILTAQDVSELILHVGALVERRWTH